MSPEIGVAPEQEYREKIPMVTFVSVTTVYEGISLPGKQCPLTSSCVYTTESEGENFLMRQKMRGFTAPLLYPKFKKQMVIDIL